MALGVVRDLRSPRSLDAPGEAAAYQEHLMAEYVLARLAHGVTNGTIRGEITAVEQFLEHAAGPTRPGPAPGAGGSSRSARPGRAGPASAPPGHPQTSP